MRNKYKINGHPLKSLIKKISRSNKSILKVGFKAGTYALLQSILKVQNLRIILCALEI